VNAADPVSMAETPSRIGRYEILREIGRGAMGVVYEARDPALDRTIALKVIQPSAGGEAARVQEGRFLAEAKIAAALQHPGIVVVHDVGLDPATGATFIALELLRGRNLADLAEGGPMDWRTVMGLVAQVARALGHAHRHGVVHRDVKPANIVLLPSGEAKIMDFGIARLEGARQRLTTTGEFVGTPLFTAPEQAKHEEVDGRADVFSLASVAYSLLTGRAAFLAPSIPAIVHRVVYEEPDPPSGFVPGLPPDVERVLARALAKEPARRYPTAEAFAEDAEDVLAGRPPRHLDADELVVVEEPDSPLAALLEDGGPAHVTPSPPPAPPWFRRPAGAAAVVGSILGLLVFAVWLSGRAPSPAEGPASRGAAGPAPSAPGRLRIDFDHPLRSGILRIYVDDELALAEAIAGQKRKKALVFRMHEGSFRDELEVAAGLHEVRVEVRWDDSVRTERIVGRFRPGATRRLDASLGRIRRDLKLEWK
jgi:predicted Ser/Thr protein kinase